MGRLISSLRNEWANFRFWLARKRLQENIDYQIIVDEEYDGVMKVKLLRGKFKDVVFVFGQVEMREEEDGIGSLDFCTYVLDNPSGVDVTSKAFVNITSNLMRALLVRAFREESKLDEIGKDDTVESDEERGIREESDPVLERRVSNRKSRAKTVSGDTGTHGKVQQATKRSSTKASPARKIRPNRK